MIRGATLDDTDAICRMASSFIKAYFDGKIADNSEQVRQLARDMMQGGERLLLLHDSGHGADGMIAMFIFKHPISGERIAGELAWWVDPQVRGSAGIALMKRAEEWARTSGAIRIQMVAPNERVGEFYRRVGYDKVETTYTKEI